MKLPKGVTVYAYGGKKFVGEIPDELGVMTGVSEPVAASTNQKKSDKVRSGGSKPAGTS